jgi:hypothetical protein
MKGIQVIGVRILSVFFHLPYDDNAMFDITNNLTLDGFDKDAFDTLWKK